MGTEKSHIFSLPQSGLKDTPGQGTTRRNAASCPQSLHSALKDAKSRLQEWLQSKQFDLPHYELMETRGNAPHQIFVVRCQVNINNCPDITESGESRRIAEQKAAELMINQLHKLPGQPKKRS